MRMFASRFYLVLGLVLAAGLSNAQTAPSYFGYGGNGVFVQAVQSKSAQQVGNEVVSQMQFRVSNGSAPTKYYDRAVSFNKGNYGGKVKHFVKGNAGVLATVGITLGVGMFLDYITGDLYGQEATPALTCTAGVYESNLRAFQACTLAAVVQHDKKLQLQQYLNLPSSYEQPYFEYFTLDYTTVSGGNTTYHYKWNAKYFWNGTGPYDTCGAGCNNPILYRPNETQSIASSADAQYTDAALADWWLQNAPTPEVVNAPLNSPATGAALRDTTVAQAEKDLYNEIAPTIGKGTMTAAPLAPPAYDQQKAPSYDEQNTPESGGSVNLEFPNFCSWASAVCSAIDWMRETPTAPPNADFEFQDMITETTPEVVNYSAGLGSGSCPSPKSFSVLGNSLTYSYQPICDLADIARIFVILFAYLSSIYIVMGVKR